MSDLQSLASIDAMIMREIDPRLLQRVGPADARIDPKSDFISHSEHAILMHCIKHQIRPIGMINTEIGSIMRERSHNDCAAAMEAQKVRREGGK